MKDACDTTAFAPNLPVCALVREFILFHRKRHPAAMGEREIKDFLAHPARARSVAAATQNQALSAILFLYKDGLNQPLDWLGDLPHAKQSAQLPVVFTKSEVQAILSRLHGALWLMASLFYASGLRLMECVRLRAKVIALH